MHGIPAELLPDHWYVAEFGTAITRAPIRRTILDEPIVFYRRRDGGIVALHDRCPHRSFPLSRGEVKGDALQCGYHGFTFEPSGACSFVPGQAEVPRAACVRAFPVVERGPFAWIWMGDAGLADPARIPAHSWTHEPGWTTFVNSTTLACRYGMLLDNLMDLSHETYLHRATIGTPEVAATPITTAVEGNVVRLWRRMDGAECPPFYRKATGIVGRIDRSQEITYDVPAFWTLHVRVAPAGDTGRGCNMKVMHGITPETRHSTHDFWAISRDFATDQQWVGDAMAALQDRIVFEEDKPALEALEVDYPAGRVPEVSVNIDRGALQARRLVHELIRGARPAIPNGRRSASGD